jgi:hypothetical protein
MVNTETTSCAVSYKNQHPLPFTTILLGVQLLVTLMTYAIRGAAYRKLAIDNTIMVWDAKVIYQDVGVICVFQCGLCHT